jgi:hypothetical protein
VRPSFGTRRRPGGRRPGSALVALLLLGAAGCATTPERLPPVLGGVPADQVDALVGRWEAEWREFRGLRAVVDLTVVKRGRAQRTAGALLVSPTHLRFEAITPLGFPALVVTAGPERLLVFSPTERRAWSARPTAEAMSRWLGVPLEPQTLTRILTGHVPAPPEGAALRVTQERGPHLRFERAGVIQRVWVTAEGHPARFELANGQRVTATFERTLDGRIVSVALEVPKQSVEAQLRYVSGESIALPPEAFEIAVPPDVVIERVD